jgi:hypothetical protein
MEEIYRGNSVIEVYSVQSTLVIGLLTLATLSSISSVTSLRVTTTTSSSSFKYSLSSTTTSTLSTSIYTRTLASITIVSPIPSGALYDVQANGVALIGIGLLIVYTSRSLYVASILACTSEYLITSSYTNIYFVTRTNCNLHYGLALYMLNTNGVNTFSLYDISCFTSTTIALLPPPRAICNIQANSVALTRTSLLIIYTSRSLYIASILAYTSKCLTTSSYTNIYFVAKTNYNLYYGLALYILNTNRVNAYSFYDASYLLPTL